MSEILSTRRGSTKQTQQSDVSRASRPDGIFVEAVEITEAHAYGLQVGKKFAGGGYADVHRGTITLPGGTDTCQVAVKILRCNRTTDSNDGTLERIDKRLSREMKVWSRLMHPRITPLIAYAKSSSQVITGGGAALVSPYRENADLRTYLSKTPDADRLLLLQQVCEGLNYLHTFEPPITHLDLKPDNILINQNGEAEICDFGLAKVLGETSTGLTTSTFGTGGSLIYIAPEALNGETQTPASDIYSMAGVILHAMSGRPPWEKMPQGQVVLRIVQGKTPPRKAYAISGYGPPQVDSIWILMEQCWALNPHERPKAEEVLTTLTSLRKSSSSTDYNNVDPGTSLHDLQLGERFAVGTYADIYRATMIRPGGTDRCQVAVKVIRYRGMTVLDQQYEQTFKRIDKRLRREVKVWKRLAHPRITPLLAYESPSHLLLDGGGVLVLPYRKNANISTYLSRNPSADKLLLLQQACEGLNYMHTFVPPIAHLDLKPDNILINDDGEAELCDFGLAKVLEDAGTGFTTSTSGTGGTLVYMAPEALNGEPQTTASDIYSLGGVVLSVISGILPWGSTPPGKVIIAVARGETPPREGHVISGYNMTVADSIWILMERCWSFNPPDRPRAQEVLKALIDLQESVAQGKEGMPSRLS